MQFARPFFITPHAVNRYRERYEPGAPAGRIIHDVQFGLQQPHAVRSWRGALKVRASTPAGREFYAIVMPPDDPDRWPSVVTIE